MNPFPPLYLSMILTDYFDERKAYSQIKKSQTFADFFWTPPPPPKNRRPTSIKLDPDRRLPDGFRVRFDQ